MIPLQHIGAQTVVLAASQATNASAAGIVQVGGRGDYLNVVFSLDTQAAPTSKPSVMKIQESDTTETTAFVDIPSMVGDGPNGFSIPNADASSPQTINLGVDWKGRKKWARVEVRPSGVAQNIAAVAIISRGDDNVFETISTLNHYG